MQAMFFHAVYFYPREDAKPGDAEALAAGCRHYLANIPSLTYFSVGHTAGTQRDVVDNAYCVALLTGFADSEGHDAYQVHPDHLAFIEANKKYFSRVRIYDSLVA